uniref:Uncharacterized protein n=1 Tax=viral metagenome TaxID=1070528 RepID=A0A6C0E7Y1_9ZZZZ
MKKSVKSFVKTCIKEGLTQALAPEKKCQKH